MKEYFKYCSVEELREEIRNRFAGVRVKMDRISEGTRTDQSVNRKFYDYVSEIKSKQRQYESILNEPTELNYLLKKRRNKINESLEKYERNMKCKTFSDFKLCESNGFDLFERANESPFHLQQPCDIAQPLFSPLNQHTLLQRGRNHQTNPRSKTQANFFNKSDKRQQKLQCSLSSHQKEDQSRKLRSITKVVHITVNNINTETHQHKDKYFSFAKTNSHSKLNRDENLQTHAAKKAIRFDTAPQIPQTSPKNSERLESCLNRKTIDQICIKKIKQRIKTNLNNCKMIHKGESSAKIRELELIFEEESLQRIQLKQQILSSNQLYQQLKATRGMTSKEI